MSKLWAPCQYVAAKAKQSSLSERDLPTSERENGWWVAYGSKWNKFKSGYTNNLQAKWAKKNSEVLYAVCVKQFKHLSASLLTFAPWYFDFPWLPLTVGTMNNAYSTRLRYWPQKWKYRKAQQWQTQKKSWDKSNTVVATIGPYNELRANLFSVSSLSNWNWFAAE